MLHLRTRKFHFLNTYTNSRIGIWNAWNFPILKED
jgi:hypothetical protein